MLLKILIFMGFAGALLGQPVWAEKADREKPMYIESDTLKVDDLNQTYVAIGKVLLTKGSITIRGARLDARQDAEGYQYGTVTATPGALASYRQKREGLDEFIEGEGEVIVYDGKADTVHFVKRAEMRRYRGSKLFDQSNGDLIVYDNTADVFTVESGQANAAGPSGTGRVHTMLTPAPKPQAPASGAALPGLKPTATMDEGRK